MIKLLILSLAVFEATAQQSLPFTPRIGTFNNPYTPRAPFAGPNAYTAPYIPILDYSNEINVDGSYRYSFVTADGKTAEESGYLKDVSVGKDGEPLGIQVVQGSYSYTAPDGTPVQVTYIADENGFQPTSIRLSGDGRLPVNTLGARTSPLASQFKNPYNTSPFLGRYTQPFFNNYNNPAIKINKNYESEIRKRTNY